MPVTFGVLGPVVAWSSAGTPIDLKGPKHRAVLARLVIARGRIVPVNQLVDDLWEQDPPAGAVSSIRTFVAALRRAVEPERKPRVPAELLVTEGPGYALRTAPATIDAWRFDDAITVAAAESPHQVLDRITEALSWWRGPAYADFDDEHWARAERSRLEQLRLTAIERQAEARLALGLAADAIPDLDAHVTAHPWREEGWRLLALALYRADRQGDALAVLRRARDLLREQLGVDPGPRLRQLETDILRQAEPVSAGTDGTGTDAAGRAWAQATAAYNHTVAPGARARLESTVGLLRSLAMAGPSGLEAARDQRLGAISAAEQLGDPELTARVIGGYDVPAIWTRSDDPEQAAQIVATAERVLVRLSPDAPAAARARLLATIAIESRGTGTVRAAEAAAEAEGIARRLGDPALLAFTLNGVFMQSFLRAGLAPQRDLIGAELVSLSARHGLATFEILGHLVRLQARSALADFTGGDEHAAAADRLAGAHERPLVSVFTEWYAALRSAATGSATEAEAAYRRAGVRLAGAGMPGVEGGLLPLALLGLSVSDGRPLAFDDGADFGPYEPWVRPLRLLARDREDAAAEALRGTPYPPHDLLFEALWVLTARAAITLGDRDVMRRALAELTPAEGEIAGAGSGMLTVGPVSRHLDDLAAALR